MFAGDFTSRTIHQDLIGFGTIVVRDKPEWQKDMLKGLLGEAGLDLEVAVSISRNLRGALGTGFLFLSVARFLRSATQIDLVLFHDPASDVGRIVRDQAFGRERFDPAKEMALNASGGADQFVIKKVL